MESNERDIDWRADAPTLAAIGNRVPFTLPSGYFEALSNNLQSRILIESVIDGSKDPFLLPDGYFEALTSRIESNITVENIRESTPDTGFSVPESYFSGLTERINSKLEEPSKKSATVRRLFSSWVSYAAAACITVMIASGIYFSTNTYNFTEELSEVPDQEIINYLQAHSTAGDTPFIMENINPDELEHINTDVSAEELELYINNTTL